MKRTAIKRSTKGLARKTRPKRTSELKRTLFRKAPKLATNRRRKARKKARAFARAYHSEEFVLWTQSQPCSVSTRLHECKSRIVCAHGPKRKGSGGGTWRDVLPWCLELEIEFHGGITGSEFEAKYQIDLRASADAHAAAWEEREAAQ